MTDRLLAAPAPSARATADGPARRWPVWSGIAALALLGCLHVWAVWSTYHVGSFDDDGHYVALGRALAGGLGFVDTSLPGDPVEMNRPPGTALLYALPAAVASAVSSGGPEGATWPFQALSVVCFVACFPLLWHWMRLRRVGIATGFLVLALLAMNPLAGTYGAMVMVEMPFLVTLLCMLIALHHWDRRDRVFARSGVAAVALLAWLLALKSAALAFYPGVVGYLLLRRWFGKAALAVGAGLLVLVPVAVNRVVHGVSPLGKRDSGYFEQYEQHPVRRLLDVLPERVYEFVTYAVPNSIVPLAHVPTPPGVSPGMLLGLRWLITGLVIAGFLAWHAFRGIDATLVIIPVYVAQSLTYPFINERRIILILPLVLLWFVLGARVLGDGVARLWRAATAMVRRRPLYRRRPLAAPVSLALCALAALPMLAVQFDRNYRLPEGMDTSQPKGSSYVHTLRAVTDPGEPIASSYRWTIAAFTGRDTLNTVHFHPCNWPARYEDYAPEKLALLREESYGAVLFAALNTPWRFDDVCTLTILDRHPAWAVRIHRQPRDKAVVYQLIGPGTANPDLSDVTLGRPVSAGGAKLRQELEQPYVRGDMPGPYHVLEPDPASAGRARLVVPFDGPVPVTQVSLGAAGQRVGAAESITVELRAPDGTWSPVWGVRGADVDTREAGPDVVVRRLDAPRTATAARVVFRGEGPYEVHDLHVLARTGHRGEPALG